MKKVFLYNFFIILIVANHINGMTQTRNFIKQMRTKSSAVRPTMQQTILYTKPYIKPTLTDKVKQYYRTLKRWWRGPALTYDQIVKEADLIANKLKTKTSGSIEDLDYFLNEQKQKEVNVFLNRFITTKEGLFLLNEYTFALWQEYGSKGAEVILKKILIWAQDDILKIFYTIPSLENSYLINHFFLVTLLLIPEGNILEQLIKNTSTIIRTPNGRAFFTFLKSQKKDSVLYGLYDTIATRNEQIPLQLKTIAAEQAEKLITRE